jgi:hypothetical protein
MTAAMEPATMEPATVKPTAVEFTAVVFATVEFAVVFTVEPIMESAEAFAAESAIAPPVRGIAVAVASVIPPSLATSRQAEGHNQKRAKHNQFYFHYPDASAGGENDERSGGSAFAAA